MPKSIAAAAQHPRASKSNQPSLAIGHAARLPDHDLLDFDVDADLRAIIPMPATIPAPVRASISHALGASFTYADDLDAWVHAPHAALHGATPFETIVAGDGIAVLRALSSIESTAHTSGSPQVEQMERPTLTVVR